jgi:AcrR family transcriptional regulator
MNLIFSRGIVFMGERRRGADLEQALLEAAWLELIEHGYSGLTMEGVAARAGTSRPVIARRWAEKPKLAVAAIRQQMAKHPLEVLDRGNLRAELLEFLERASARAVGIAAAFTLFTSEYLSEASSNPEALHLALIRGEDESLSFILKRGLARGDIDPERLTPPVTSLLADLFRHYALMNFAAPPPALREAWVDSVFLPLVSPSRPPSKVSIPSGSKSPPGK